MGTTVTWAGGTSGVWSSVLNWTPFEIPTAADDVVIGAGDSVTIAGSTSAAADDIGVGPGSANASLAIYASLTLDGTLSDLTVGLYGTLLGGTLDGDRLQGDGGTLEDVVLQGTDAATLTGWVTIDPLTAASLASPVAVDGTVGLEPGLYDGITFTLDPTWEYGSGDAILDGAGVTLGPRSTLVLGDARIGEATPTQPPETGQLVLDGSLVNQGAITGEAIGVTISGDFTNQGTVALAPVTTSASIESRPETFGPDSWNPSYGPTVDVLVGAFDNAGLIALTGGTLAVEGNSFVNSGTIAFTDGTSQFLSQAETTNGIENSIDTRELGTEVDIGGPDTFIDNTGTISADLIRFTGPVALGSLGSLDGAVAFDGVLGLGGGTLDASPYHDVTIDGLVKDGTLAAGTGTLILYGATLDDVAIASGGSVVTIGSIALEGVASGAGSVVLDGTTTQLLLDAGMQVSGATIDAIGPGANTLSVTGGTATLAPSGTLLAAGTLLDLLGPGTLEDDGAISVASGSLAAAAAIDGAGTIALAPATTLSETASLAGSLSVAVGSGAVLGAATIADGVAVTVDSGATVDLGTLEGNAVVTLEAGARVAVDALAGTPTIVFDGVALVTLPGTGPLPVTLQNLAAGDLVDFAAVSNQFDGLFGAGGAGEAEGSLDVTGASGDTARVGVQGQTSFLEFSTTGDTQGGTLVTAAACFCAGTRIATARGAVPIELLRRGELIRTAAGRLTPVVWVGRRRVECPSEAVWPVRIAAHAFAPGRPARDLFVSPDHAVFWHGVLIPVRYLLNGATIAQRPVARVEYWHVELPAHDLLLAENLPTESFLDTGNRVAFERTKRRAVLPAAAALRVWRARGCAKLLTAGPRLAALHARLLARARRLGYVLTEAPALRVVADGCEAVPLGGLRFRLPAGARTIRLLSRSYVPAHLGEPGGDARRLGIAVGRVLLDERPLPLDDPRLGAGWHAPEPRWRWTAGDAAIAAAGAHEIAVEVAIAGRYWCG